LDDLSDDAPSSPGEVDFGLDSSSSSEEELVNLPEVEIEPDSDEESKSDEENLSPKQLKRKVNESTSPGQLSLKEAFSRLQVQKSPEKEISKIGTISTTKKRRIIVTQRKTNAKGHIISQDVEIEVDEEPNVVEPMNESKSVKPEIKKKAEKPEIKTKAEKPEVKTKAEKKVQDKPQTAQGDIMKFFKPK